MKERYYFENLEEMLSYVKLNPNAEVEWASGNEYLDRFKKGYLLADQRRFGDAIAALKKALEVNPIGISARFEIVECYMQMGQFSQAKQDLIEISKLVIRNQDKARFFRRYGFISTEEENYKLAFSCYTYSLGFEQNGSVSNELMYIASKARINFKAIDVKQELRKAGLPLFEESSGTQQDSSSGTAGDSKNESQAVQQKKGIFSSFFNKHVK